MLWMIPSFFGDIRVVSTSPTTCKVLVEQATEQEQQALKTLHKEALKKKWLEPTTTDFGAVTELHAPIEKVSKLIAKALKPGKRLVSAVKFANGKMEEVTEATFKLTATSNAKPPTTRSEAGETTSRSTPTPEPAVATTVAAPVRGCPAPDFSPARLRAREVLSAFLTPEQREDFERYDRFVAVGRTTGHRYMITSRHAKDSLASYQRTLFDLHSTCSTTPKLRSGRSVRGCSGSATTSAVPSS